MIVMQSDKPFRVRQVQFDELDNETVQSWESLEDRALESNAFLSPRFVIPAMRHLGKPEELRQTMFALWRRLTRAQSDSFGAGVFAKIAGNRSFPLPHLRAFRSLHSYLAGILVDRNKAEGTLRSFFQFFCNKNATWHGVDI